MKTFDHFRFFAGSSCPQLAKNITNTLGAELSPTTIKKFSCGETYVRLDESVRGKDVYIIHTIRPKMVNEDFMELFLLCNAAKQSFAQHVHVVVPHFGYSRQDKIHAARETISAKLMADLMVKSGATQLITLQLHSDQTQGFFDIPVDNLCLRKSFVEYFEQKNINDLVVVSPDAGGAKDAHKFANLLGADLAIIHKTRPAHNVSEVIDIVGNVEGKTCVLFDDMIDTAGSVCAAKQALEKNGANRDIYLCATHPIFSGPAYERLKEAQFKEIIVSNSLPIDQENLNNNPSITLLDTAPFIAKVIENNIAERSVSTLHL